MVHYELNEEQNGIELYFDGIFPDVKLRNKMKSFKMRWNPKKKCWWTYQSNTDGVKFIKDFCAQYSDENDEFVTFDRMINGRCCYADSIINFNKENENDFIDKIKSSFLEEY